MKNISAMPNARQDCEHCNLSTVCLPCNLDELEMKKLDSIIKRRKPKQRGDTLYRNGDSFRSVYAVRTGSIKTYVMTVDGAMMITGFYLAGDIFGLDAIHSKVHCNTAVTLETTSICEIPFSQLEHLGHEIPALQHQTFRMMSKEIGHEQKLMLLLNKKTSEQRLATFLLRVAARNRRRGCAALEFNLSMSRGDIANYLGLAPETVSRIITRFSQQKIIIVNRKLVQIRDEALLQNIANELAPVA
jgi:CRP/FNR family transcriptional regulator, anaerobic regulatory protein